MRGVLVLALALGGCSDLPDLGTCGNGIIEAELGEACDGDLAGADTCTETCELACQTSAVTDAYVVVPSSSATEQYCPDARLACGLDGICRGSSGQFTSIGGGQTFNAKLAVAGDFDGDGIADLLGTSATEIIVRLGAATAFTDGFEQAAPSSDSPLAIFENRSEEAASMAIAVPTDGLALLTSDGEVFGPNLDLSFPINPTGQAAFIIDDPEPALQGSQAVMAVARMGQLAVQRIPLSGAHTQQALPACGPANARLVTVAVAPDQRSFVVVGRPLAGAGFFLCHYTQAGATFQVAQTNINAIAPDAAAFAQLDNEPCLDLAFTRLAPPPGTPSVFAAPATPGSCDFGGALVTLADLTETDVLLAAGSVVPRAAGVERDELVLDSGVYQVAEDGSLERVIGPTSDINPWTAAAVVDLNGDGQLDVVAGRKAQDDVDIVRGGPVPNVYRADTTTAVTAISAGDFDGDRVGDVALIETSVNANQRISILYGARDGVVGAPVVTSKFEGTLLVARLGRATWSGTNHGTDGVDDLVVARVFEGEPTAGILIGDPARIMSVPRLPDPLSAGQKAPSLGVVAVGAFASNPATLAATLRPDLESPATDSLISTNDIATNVWTDAVVVPQFEVDTLRAPALVHTTSGGMVGVFGKPEQSGKSTIALVGIDGQICTRSFDGLQLTIRAADLVGDDGIDEVIVTTPGGRHAQVFPVVAGASCELQDEILTSALDGCADVANVGGHLIALCETEVPRRSGVFRIGADGTREPNPAITVDGTGLQFVVGDFDGDGVRDAAVMIGRAAEISVQFLKQCPAHDTRGCQ